MRREATFLRAVISTRSSSSRRLILAFSASISLPLAKDTSLVVSRFESCWPCGNGVLISLPSLANTGNIGRLDSTGTVSFGSLWQAGPVRLSMSAACEFPHMIGETSRLEESVGSILRGWGWALSGALRFCFI